MAVPKKRKSQAKTRSRRANHDITKPVLTQRCDNCYAPRRPHRACAECGQYREEQVVEVWEQV
ncbi:MAG: 50S ribosomal protein L32 [Bradymonadaceae bacterium]|nr:50S ribosomal protein L32 [Lujinxingiaceae bacterium]